MPVINLTNKPLDRYHSDKQKLLEAISQLENIDNQAKIKLEQIKHNLESDSFTLAVLGQFKRGKTTLVNAILGKSLLPTAVLPLTSVITLISYDAEETITVVFQDGRRAKLQKEEIEAYVTEKKNPKNEKKVERLEVNIPSDFLSGGMTLVDTPGIGSVYHHNTDIAYQFLPNVDAAVFVLSVDPPISDAECKFLEESAKYAAKLFFVINKADHAEKKELDDLLTFNRQIISQKTAIPPAKLRVMPLSAKRALDAKLHGDLRSLEKSGLLAFELELEQFVVLQKGSLVLASSKSKILRTARELLNQRLLEKKGLEMSLDSLEERFARFEAEVKEILSQEGYQDELIELEQKKILETIDEDLAELKRRAYSELVEDLTKYADSLENMNNREFASAVDEYRQERILHVLEHWRNAEEEKASALFAEKMGKLSGQVEEAIIRIETLASDIFEIRMEMKKTEERLTLETKFYFKLNRFDDAGLVSVLSDMQILLPSSMFRKKLISSIPREVAETLDRNAGRMRYDFLERLQKSSLDFKWALREKLEIVIEGIRTAKQKAIHTRKEGEEKIRARTTLLESEISTIRKIVEKLEL